MRGVSRSGSLYGSRRLPGPELLSHRFAEDLKEMGDHTANKVTDYLSTL